MLSKCRQFFDEKGKNLCSKKLCSDFQRSFVKDVRGLTLGLALQLIEKEA
jgi:hypothetical protein